MKKITRTIDFTVARVLFADVDAKAMTEKDITLPSVYDSEKELLKDIPTEGNYIPLKVVETTRFTKKYVISVNDFLAAATEIIDD